MSLNMNNDALEKAQSLFEYSKSSTVRSKWFENYNVCKLYYEGDQWQDKELNKQMKEISATRYTFNQIERIINLYTSLQIRSGKRSGFSIKDDVGNSDDITRNLKQLSYKIHTDSDYTYFSSTKFTDMLIGGIGWSTYDYNEHSDNKLIYKTINPVEMFFDPDDDSLKLNNSSFVCRSHYLPQHILEEKYPKKKAYFKELVVQNENTSYFMSLNDDVSSGVWARGRTIRITEVQYKKSETALKVTIISKEREILEDFAKRTFLMFEDIEEIERLLNEYFGDIDFEVEEVSVSRIYKTVYSGDNLLEHGPLVVQTPNQSQFSYLPVMLRRDSEGIPYGVTNLFLSLQDSRNYLWSTILHYVDAKTLVVNLEGAPLVDRATAEAIIRKELSVKKGLIFNSSGRDYQVIDHTQEVGVRLQMLQTNAQELENLSGLYNTELSGTENKTMSGVAINMRSINTMNAQNHILLAYDSMLISEGNSLLNAIKGVEDLAIKVRYKLDGKTYKGDVDFTYKTMSYDVFVDTTSNFLSSAEEDRIRLTDILSSPNAHLLLSSEVFLKSLGFNGNKASELVTEFKKIRGETEGGEDVEGEQEGEGGNDKLKKIMEQMPQVKQVPESNQEQQQIPESNQEQQQIPESNQEQQQIPENTQSPQQVRETNQEQYEK